MKKGEDGKITVTFNDSKTKEETGSGVYDTVLLAIGRVPETKYLNLDKVGVKVNNKGFIEVNDED